MNFPMIPSIPIEKKAWKQYKASDTKRMTASKPETQAKHNAPGF